MTTSPFNNFEIFPLYNRKDQLPPPFNCKILYLYKRKVRKLHNLITVKWLSVFTERDQNFRSFTSAKYSLRVQGAKNFAVLLLRDIRDLKHRRRRTQRTTTGSKISPYRASAQARLVVLVQFRTSKRQVCRPERTWVCLNLFTQCFRPKIYIKLLKWKLVIY